MKLILSNKDLCGYVFPEDVGVIYVSLKQLSAYNHNTDVVAIAGSRAMAIEAEKMDLPSLKLIQLTSAGFDGVPCEEYANRNVAVANAGTTYSVPIAETVVFGILFMTKKFAKIRIIGTLSYFAIIQPLPSWIIKVPLLWEPETLVQP